MNKDIKNGALGEFIRDQRLARGLTLNDVAKTSGLHLSYWSKLENGAYHSPSPKYLKVIGRTLDLGIEDLYALAGYAVPQRLPALTPYLRAKYELPAEAIADLERYFEMLRNYYAIPNDRPVFPPRQNKPVNDPPDGEISGPA